MKIAINYLQTYQIVRELFSKKRHRIHKTFRQGNSRPPAQARETTHIELFLRGAVRFRGVPVNCSVESSGLRYGFREIADAQINSSTDI